MTFRFRLITPNDELEFLCSAGTHRQPKLYTVCYNNVVSSYFLDFNDPSPAVSEVIDSSDTDQTFRGATDWLYNQGYPVVNSTLVKQLRPPTPVPFTPNRLPIPQQRRLAAPAPVGRNRGHATRPSEATLVASETEEEEEPQTAILTRPPTSQSSRSRLRTVLRRNAPPGPPRNAPSRSVTPHSNTSAG